MGLCACLSSPFGRKASSWLGSVSREHRSRQHSTYSKNAKTCARKYIVITESALNASTWNQKIEGFAWLIFELLKKKKKKPHWSCTLCFLLFLTYIIPTSCSENQYIKASPFFFFFCLTGMARNFTGIYSRMQITGIFSNPNVASCRQFLGSRLYILSGFSRSCSHACQRWPVLSGKSVLLWQAVSCK